MRFIPVPDAAMRQYPHCQRIVMAPPDGDLTNDDIRAAEVLKDASGFRMFFTLEEGDLSEIERFKQVYLELFIMGAGMPPVSLISWPDAAMGLKDEVEDSENVEEALIDQLEAGIRIVENACAAYIAVKQDHSVMRWLSGAKDTIAKARGEE